MIITKQKRRQMYSRALATRLAAPRPPICQSCWRAIGGHSRYLHRDCAALLQRGDVYLNSSSRRALERYEAEHAERPERETTK